MKRFVIGFTVLLVCTVVLGFMIQSRFLCHCTDSANAILNNLRQIDGAKAQWVTDHPGVKVTELSRHDLSPYLNKRMWEKSVAGEIYLIHGPDEPSEALMTQKVEWIPEGAKLRFSPKGDIQVQLKASSQWSNNALEPTATAP